LNQGNKRMVIEKDKPMPGIAFRAMSFYFALRHRLEDVTKPLKKAGITEGQIILDFGCGPGHYAIAAAKMVGQSGRVYALDIHPLAARSVEKKAAKDSLTNIKTILSKRDTGLPDQSIDTVLVYDTIHMIKDKQALTKELHRVLKPDGLLSVIAEHVKVDDIIKMLEQDGLFSLRDRQGNLINLKRLTPK
jgi:ubiquinone/menaquinone biosynthesis C-methylase UbiE